MHMDAFGDYDFDEHPFRGLGGYEQARRVFGGQSALDRLIRRVQRGHVRAGRRDRFSERRRPGRAVNDPRCH